MDKKLIGMISGAVGIFLIFLFILGINQHEDKAIEPKPNVASIEGNKANIADKDVSSETFIKDISGLKLMQLIEGEEAKKQITELHRDYNTC